MDRRLEIAIQNTRRFRGPTWVIVKPEDVEAFKKAAENIGSSERLVFADRPALTIAGRCAKAHLRSGRVRKVVIPRGLEGEYLKYTTRLVSVWAVHVAENPVDKPEVVTKRKPKATKTPSQKIEFSEIKELI